MTPDAAGAVSSSLDQSRSSIRPSSDIEAMTPADLAAQSCPECEQYVPSKIGPCPCCIEGCSTCEEDIPVVCHGLCPEGVCSDDTCPDGPTRDEWICEDENCSAQVRQPFGHWH